MNQQNKGIGAYKDRPGYFMGGMIGGAILGALVNKIQGKDWKRGAIMGGIGGGIGSALGTKFAPAAGGKANWLQKMLYKQAGPAMSEWTPRFAGLNILGQNISPVALAGGVGAAYLAGDPEYDQRKWEEKLEAQKAAQRKKNLDFYSKWYTNPWTGESMYNTGGIVNSRPKYYNGGGAWSDVAGEEDILGSGQDKILSITGQSGLEGQQGLEDIIETFEMSETGSGIEAYHKLLADKYRPWLEDMDIDTTGMEDFEVIEIYDDLASKYAHSAQGGYKTRPGYMGGGIPSSEDLLERKRVISGIPSLEELLKLRMILGGLDNKIPSTKDFLERRSEGGRVGMYGGGTGDLDMTGGGASFGPGTGTSDDIPAMLSDGEFVVTANAVQNLGGGDRMLGARRMYSMMNQLDPNSQTPAEMNTVGLA